MDLFSDERDRAKQRIAGLSKEIEEHNYRYYQLAEPVISDFEFDQLLEELLRLEKQFPEFLDANSPSQRVGGGITKEFESIKHRYPMLSLGNTYSKEELEEFDQRVRKGLGVETVNYVCELKYDGVAIGIRYSNGELVQAVTRGDGVQGDDVTTNIRTIRSIPLKLNANNIPNDFEIRGEVLMSRITFNKINADKEKAGEALLANPRNAGFESGGFTKIRLLPVWRFGQFITIYYAHGKFRSRAQLGFSRAGINSLSTRFTGSIRLY